MRWMARREVIRLVTRIKRRPPRASRDRRGSGRGCAGRTSHPRAKGSRRRAGGRCLAGKSSWAGRWLVAELEAIVVEGVAHPGIPQAVRCQADVRLAPDFLVFERVSLAEGAPEVPGEWVDSPALLDVLDDDREIGARAEEAAQPGVDGTEPSEELVVVAHIAEIGGIVRVEDGERLPCPAALRLGATGSKHVPVGR